MPTPAHAQIRVHLKGTQRTLFGRTENLFDLPFPAMICHYLGTRVRLGSRTTRDRDLFYSGNP